MKRGDFYRVYKGNKYEPKSRRVFVVVSRQLVIDSKFSTANGGASLFYGGRVKGARRLKKVTSERSSLNYHSLVSARCLKPKMS